MDRRDIITATVGVVGGALVGGALTYILSKKYLERVYTEIAIEQVQNERNHWTQKFEELQANMNEKASQEVLVREEPIDLGTLNLDFDAYADVLIKLGYSGDQEDLRLLFDKNVSLPKAIDSLLAPSLDDEDEPVELENDGQIHRIFDENVTIDLSDPEMEEYEEYCKTRDRSEPYLIHINEFMSTRNTEFGHFEKISLKYYEEDDTLVDDRNIPIPDVRRLVGDTALESFGKFSSDRNLVYVRNERPDVEADFEILHIESSFVAAVHGVIPRQGVGKFKEDDE